MPTYLYNGKLLQWYIWYFGILAFGHFGIGILVLWYFGIRAFWYRYFGILVSGYFGIGILVFWSSGVV